MPRSLSKKPVKRQTKTAIPAGRILEMKPVSAPRTRRGGLGLFILTLVAVGSISVAALSFQKMAVAFDYIETANRDLVAANAKAAELKTKITNLETLQALSNKTATPAVPDVSLWLDYSSPNLSLKYPVDYTLVKATSAFPALTIKSDKGRVEIFRASDFPSFDLNAAGKTPEQIDQTIPKEFKIAASDQANTKVTPYNAWVYYTQGDEVTKAVLDQIVASIKVTK